MMEDNRENFTDNQPEENMEVTQQIDGEYHFVRPERKLYEDAEFVPQDETTDIPNYYVPGEKKTKDRKSDGKGNGTLLKVVCLCLVCAIVGGLMGGFVSWKVIQKNNVVSETQKPIVASTGGTKISASSGEANDIYELACKQTVGITTDITYTNVFGQTSSTAVSGTGFVVSSDGYIITNYHVIEYAYNSNNKITVLFKDGTSYEASIAGAEEENDIAVLKIDATDLVPVSVGDSDGIAVGDNVFAIGNPLGELDFTMTSGRVSALDRSIVTDSKIAINMFQFDAAVNSGNSGGPVYNENGEVIGVVTAKVNSSGVEGLGFAIPINDAVEIANDLITKGYVTGKAYMGVNIDNRYSSVYAEYYNLPEGAYVFNVESGSCAEACGLMAGDIITALGDNEVKSFADLNSAVRKYKAGDSAEITIYRANDYMTLTITFDESKPDADSNGVNESGLSNGLQSKTPN